MPHLIIKVAAAIISTVPLIFIIPGIISITAENLLEKSSALATVLVKESRLRESMLRESAAIKWHRMVNREAILGQGRGLVAEAPCKHCDERYSLFKECVVLPNRLDGSCCNYYYNSSGACCSFRDKCKLLNRLTAGC